MIKYEKETRDTMKQVILETIKRQYDEYQNMIKKANGDYSKLNHMRTNEAFCKLLGMKDLAMQLGFSIQSPLTFSTEWKII